MNKKLLLTLATVATVSFASFGANNADAASNTTTTNLQYNKVQNVLQDCKDGKVSGDAKWKVHKVVIGGTIKPCPGVSSKPEADKPSNEESTPEVTPPAENTTPEVDNPTTEQEKPSTSYEVSAFEQKVVELTNAERAKQGLKPLTLDVELSKVARIKSQDMKDKNYFDHNSPTYGSPFDMMKQFGISYKSAGENIAQGQQSPEAVVQAWMNSQGHRENIMNASYTHIGIGHVADNNYWTQMFIGK